MATLTAERPAVSADPGIAARAGMALWRLFTSVNFAVVQIIVLALLAVVGMTVRQLPGFAFHSASDYATEMAKLRAIYEPALGASVVDAMERLQLFHVFTSTWFSPGLVLLVVSIVICTLDRTPRLWRQAAFIRVRQPDAYFDPALPDRVSIAPGPGLTADAVARVLRRRRFTVRVESDDAGSTWIYGDRNRWSKLATLVSHLGLILFLVAGLVTARLGDEQGLVVADGDTLSVQPIGTPDLLLVQNFGFSAPGIETGTPTDFTTDLAVYRDGELLARKVIRVNDPLEVAGYTFHQNGFGPAPDLQVTNTADGSVLWSGPVPLTDSTGGLPSGALPVPGRNIGLQLLLSGDAGGGGTLVLLPYAVTGTNPDGTPTVVDGFPVAVTKGETTAMAGLGLTVSLRAFTDYTLLVAKRDPGAPLVWLAFVALITGLVITFYLPRRRIWTRLGRDGRLDLVGRADRQADFDRELSAVVGDLVAARAAGAPGIP
ncbi:MAG TPA: cytochrome c biogenesis protein ResB [Candidatus Binatus sp.]|nr:cytochrome c biogenesis protein ResB [Candidatus Binatus sp.]